MRNAVEKAAGGLAGQLASAAAHWPRATLVLALLLCVGAGWATYARLHVDTNPDLMTSPELPFRQARAALEQAFPGLRGNLLVVVEADTPAQAQLSAVRLAERLEARDSLFPSVFLPGHGDFWERHGLLYLDLSSLRATAERIEAGAPLLLALEERPWLSTFLLALARGLGRGDTAALAEGEAVIEALSAALDAFVRGEPARLDWQAALRLEAEDATPRRHLIFVEADRDFAAFEPARQALAAVREAAQTLPHVPGLEVRITGNLAVLTEEMSLVRVQMLVAGVASLLLVSAVLLAALRSVRLALATLLTLLVGLLWTSGFAALAVGHLNLLTMAFAVLYVGLGVDFGIHWSLAYRKLRRRGASPDGAASRTGRRVGGALVFCALTTAVGFYAFLPTGFTGVAELGLISGSGVFLSLLATLSVTPALLSLGLGASPKLERRRSRELRMPRWPLRHRRAVLGLAVVSGGLGALGASELRFEPDPLDVRDPRTESVRALRELLREDEISPWTIEVLAPDLERARRMAEELEALPEVGRAMTVSDWVPEQQAAKLESVARIQEALASDAGPPAPASEAQRRALLELAVTDALVQLEMDAALADAQTAPPEFLEELRTSLERLQDALRADPSLRVAELDRELFGGLPAMVQSLRRAGSLDPVRWQELPEELLRRYLAPDGRARIEVFAAHDLSAPGALARFADAVRALAPHASGAVIDTVGLARAMAEALRLALGAAVAVVALILFILLRDLRTTAVVLAPLALGSLWTAGLWAALGQSLNFANVIVLPLLLGIGVDSAIHLVERHRAGVRHEALLASETAHAVFWSALTSVASFATLAFASHRGIASLAQLLATGVTLMLVATLGVLPVLLSLGRHRRRERSEATLPARAARKLRSAGFEATPPASPAGSGRGGLRPGTRSPGRKTS